MKHNSFEQIFHYDNEFEDGIFRNDTGGELVLTPGMLLINGPTGSGVVLVAKSDFSHSDIIGLAANMNPIPLSKGEEIKLQFCIGGHIDKRGVKSISGENIDSLFDSKGISVSAILTTMGFTYTNIN